MRQFYTALAGIILLSLAIGLNGCDDTASGGSGLTDISREEPTIVDSVLAINVFKERPDGITDTFSSNADINEEIFLWILWNNIEDFHTVKVSWFSPEDDLDEPPFWEEERNFTSTTGEKITWFYIENPGDTGEWFVEIYLDGLFERSHVFWVD